MAPQSFAALIVWVLMGVTFYFVSKKNFAKVTKREMDYLILGNVQVVRGPVSYTHLNHKICC